MRIFLIRGMHDFDRSWDRFFGSKRICFFILTSSVLRLGLD